MTRAEWIDRFITINNRVPSEEELALALEYGEYYDTQSTEQVVVEPTIEKTTKLKMPSSLANIIESMDKKWLIRQYVLAAMFTAVMWYQMSHGDGLGVGDIIFSIVCFLLTPWARFLWISVFNFFFDGMGLFVIFPFWIMIIIQFALYALSYVFSIFLAPIGLLYLHLRINVFKK